MRICVYGSSSPRTPEVYLEAAKELGRLIATGGHICINGGGANGVMGALNRSLLACGGNVIGVVHEMFVDGPITDLGRRGVDLRIAQGSTLEERKRMLQEDADCFIALPGGPGTWEELWEMASLQSLGLHSRSRPVVLVNVQNFYKGFIMQLHQAHCDGLLHRDPDDILKVVDIPSEALAYLTNPSRARRLTPASVVVAKPAASL